LFLIVSSPRYYFEKKDVSRLCVNTRVCVYIYVCLCNVCTVVKYVFIDFVLIYSGPRCIIYRVLLQRTCENLRHLRSRSDLTLSLVLRRVKVYISYFKFQRTRRVPADRHHSYVRNNFIAARGRVNIVLFSVYYYVNAPRYCYSYASACRVVYGTEIQ